MADRTTPVGIIGLGQMGGAMCRTLLRAGHSVLGWDAAAVPLQAAVRDGAEAGRDPADVAARAELIVVSVPDAAASRATCLGPAGVAAGAGPGRIVVDTSTTSPEAAREIASGLGSSGVGFLDAPVSGGVRAAESGGLSMMVGGDVATLERARPVLADLASRIVHCGDVGAGQVTKACNQLIVMATIESVAEALTLAAAAGVDPWRVRDALLGGFAGSPILEQHGERMLKRDFVPGGRSVYHLKDIAVIEALEAETGLALPAFEAAAEQVRRLVARGGGDLDHAALITALELEPAADPAPDVDGPG